MATQHANPMIQAAIDSGEWTDPTQDALDEAIHAAHQSQCSACDQEESQRVETATMLAKEAIVASHLEYGIRGVLTLPLSPAARSTLEDALERARMARR